MSGKHPENQKVSEYTTSAFRSDAIPEQDAIRTPGRLTKVVEGGDLIERLPWGYYSNLNIHERPVYARAYQNRQASGRKHQPGTEKAKGS